MKNSKRTHLDVYSDYLELVANLKEENKKVTSSNLLEIPNSDIKLVVDNIRLKLLSTEGSVSKGLDLITFFIEKGKRYIENRNTVENAANIFEESEMLNQMITVFGYLMHKGEDLSIADVKNYIEFRRNRLIKDIIDNPPLMNSTSVMQNLVNVYGNVGKAKILQDFFEPMYICINNPSKEFSSFCVLNTNFPT